jgi:hypothetical protein
LKNLRGLCKFGGVEADTYPTTIADQSLIAFQKPDRLLKIVPAFWTLKADYVRIDIWHRNLGSKSFILPPYIGHDANGQAVACVYSRHVDNSTLIMHSGSQEKLRRMRTMLGRSGRARLLSA